MSEMNEHAECIQLADIIASEQHQLYKVSINLFILYFYFLILLLYIINIHLIT